MDRDSCLGKKAVGWQKMGVGGCLGDLDGVGGDQREERYSV